MDETDIANLNNIFEQWEYLQKEKQSSAYNLYTLSTYTSHLENFHSDIVKSLLDPQGLHGEGRRFLDAFLAYLQRAVAIQITAEDFPDPSVSREEGRIDILVSDNTTGKAIIIENKINNAIDQDDQLNRYYECCNKEGLDVVCILYASLDGLNFPPSSLKPEVNELTKRIAFFNNTENDLYAGWLKKCLDISTKDDSRSFIFQYRKVLHHLGFNSLERNTMEEFYKLVGTQQKLTAISEMLKKLPEHRGIKLIKNIEAFDTGHRPFEKLKKKGSSWEYILLEFYEEPSIDGIMVRFKIDIAFDASGGANIIFWVADFPETPLERAKIEIYRKYEELKKNQHMYEDFSIPAPTQESPGNFKCIRHFQLGEESGHYHTMESMDDAIVKYLKALLVAIQQTQKH